MSTLFDRLAARAVGGQKPLAPRRHHRFEGLTGGSDAVPESDGRAGTAAARTASDEEARAGTTAATDAPHPWQRIGGLEPVRVLGMDPRPRPEPQRPQPPRGDTLGGNFSGGETEKARREARIAGADLAGFDELASDGAGRGLRPPAPRRRERRDDTGSDLDTGGETAPGGAPAGAGTPATRPPGSDPPRVEGTSTRLRPRSAGEAGVARGGRERSEGEGPPYLATSPLRPAVTRAPESLAGSAPEAARRAGEVTTAETPPTETVVRVTIGSVVVRAAAPVQQPEARRPGLAEPQTSLAQYLERRRGGTP